MESRGRKQRVRSPIPLSRGEYILCQAGLVVRKIPESEAMEMLREWGELNDF